MEISNEISAKVAALYLGADCIITEKIDDSYNMLSEVGTKCKINGIVIELINGGRIKIKINILNLSAITDEDAIEVAKLGGQTFSKDNHFLAHVGKELIREYLKSSRCNVSGIDWWAIQDYLRSKSYMIPAFGITDLFEAGLAIDITKLENVK